jgi:hypothetical protein
MGGKQKTAEASGVVRVPCTQAGFTILGAAGTVPLPRRPVPAWGAEVAGGPTQAKALARYREVQANTIAALRATPFSFTDIETGNRELARYDTACRALAEARSVDEAISIRCEAAQLAAAARIANNHQAEADAFAIRMRATRRLGQLMQAQKESVGLASGGEHGGRRRIDGSRENPSIPRPTLAMQGIGKRLAHEARVLSAPSDKAFEITLADAHDRIARAARNVVREIEIEQEREVYRARTYEGGTVADLTALADLGRKFKVICPDPPWPFETSTRANIEPVLLATRGNPLRLSKDVHQVVIAPVGEHSQKPDEVYRRIERLYPGPYLELFARKPRDGWTTWGNEIPPAAAEAAE